MRSLALALAFIFFTTVASFAFPSKDNLWYTSYSEAWQMVQTHRKPLYLLVANDSADPWQMSLFKRIAVRDTLKEGFVPLFVSPYEDLAFKLPIKSLPATFIISPEGEALLSYQGLLWEADFFRVVVPLSSQTRKYNKVAGLGLPRRKRTDTSTSVSVSTDRVFASSGELRFKSGSFAYDGKDWKLNYQNKKQPLRISSWKVVNYLLLEDDKKGLIYAVPLEEKHMSYQMDKKTEIWEPFYLIEKK